MKIGFFTDVHYGKGVIYDRTCFLGLEKVRHILNEMDDCEYIFNLGDTINGGEDKEKLISRLTELKALSGYDRVISLIGNHDAFHLQKTLFAEVSDPRIGAVKTVRIEDTDFILLDGNFYHTGEPYNGTEGDWTDSIIPEPQLKWLEEQLKNSKRAIVLCHQCLINSELDGYDMDYMEDPACVRNGKEVRGILEKSGKVCQVFCGHNHKGMSLVHNGIAYQTLIGACSGENATYYLGVLRNGELALQPHVDKIR